MTALGPRPIGRLGLGPRRRSTPLAFAPDQVADLAFSYKAGDPQNTASSGAFSANRAKLQAKTAQANPIATSDRQNAMDDKEYAVFKISAASAELRDFNGAVTDTSTSVAVGTPDIVAIGASTFTPYAKIDVYEVGLYPRDLSAAEPDQLESYVKAQHGIHWSPGYLGSNLAWWFTLTGSSVDQSDDRSGKGRHWTASGGARPQRTTDAANIVVHHDGLDDVITLAGTLPVLQPFTVAVAYRVRSRAGFEAMLSAAAATGFDHENFWTFENAAVTSNNMQLIGRSQETHQLALTRIDGGVAQIAIWTTNAGNATLRDRAGEVSHGCGGSFGTPAIIVLGTRYNADPFYHAEVDVTGTIGVMSALATSDQLKLIDWTSAKWGI